MRMNPQNTEISVQTEKFSATVFRPVLTPEEEQIRRKELESAMLLLYREQNKQEHGG